MQRRARIFRYTLPLATPVHLRGNRITERSGYLLELVDEQGRAGWGEAAPLPGFSRENAGETLDELCRVAEALSQGLPPGRLLDDIQYPSVAFAAQCACEGLDPADAPGKRVLLSALLDGAPFAVLERAQRLQAEGFRAAKLKVGRETPEADAAFVRAVRAALHPSIGLRLDANRAWTLDAALCFARAVNGCALDYIEEPLRSPADWPAWRQESGIPYALDETLQDVDAGEATEDPGLLRGAAAWIWKPTLVRAHTVARLRSLATPRTVAISAAFESGVGIAALTRWATADTPAGLDTYRYLADDLLETRLPLEHAEIDVDAVAAAAQRVRRQILELVWTS